MMDYNKYYPVNEMADIYATNAEELERERTASDLSLKEKIKVIKGRSVRWRDHQEARLRANINILKARK